MVKQTKESLRSQLREAKKQLVLAESNKEFETRMIKRIKKNISMFNKKLKKL